MSPQGLRSFLIPQFNNNIRCIEIWFTQLPGNIWTWFNNNIRCIEILSITQEVANIWMFNNNIRCIEMLQNIHIFHFH